MTELKANLDKYLRMAARGTRIVVNDRGEPVAQIGPLEKNLLPWRARLAREGRLRPGSQNWSKLKISKLKRSIDVQASLRAVREDSDEERRH